MLVLPDETDRSSLRRRLDRAWERFLRDGGLEGVRPEIARSWTRSRDLYAVHPALRRAPLDASGEVLRRRGEDETFELARPVLARFAAQLGEAGHALVLLDAEGAVLSVGGDPQTVARLAELNLCPGASWREEAAGTNAAGTALAERRAVEVFASEHFVEAWHPWASAAAPILAPGSAEIAAIVQVTGPWDARERHGLVVASAVAAAIEERLRARQEVREELVRHALRAARSTGEAVVAVDARGRVIAENDAARRRFPLDDGELPRAVRERLLAALRAGEASRDEELTLEWPGAGDERRRAVGSVVAHERRAVGAILRLPAPAAPRAARGAARQRLTTRYGLEAILGESLRLRAALQLAEVAARNDLPVVLHGESGTGKELFAHGIHAGGARAGAPFVVLNCGAIPAALVEAELFGYEPGTFTGAQREGKAGKFEEADGGTLFLDEVSELPLQAQTALLRVVQESEVVRLGGSAPRRVDVRVVAATNRRLYDQVEAGRFRQDLYFRLNVLHVDIPPLRERSEDVPLLARAFLREAEERMGRDGLELSEASKALLLAHPWPGNVRELKNVIMRAAAVVAGARIEPADLRLAPVRGLPAPVRAELAPAPVVERPPAPPAREGEGPERDELVAALDACGWNIARTATSLGVSRMTLYRRLRKFGITR
ncbi:sigma-54-dependent Fis family transcriptional regulator [Anaeromyxobacter sp. SG17]|uniref:sigma-54-dependent Fis family transcriptional regulator n=1 Tax=Anaeromyxobacter sp. SG17 TaxID=2925405 RepID=UPI001F55D12B|nr:sigma-54-dependent Fis family transcriptional regulator [Anaeromyxobacter sp. SG17]